MKLNRPTFWIFSISLALLSCYLFELSSTQLYSDGDYMQSLQLPSDADTPTIPITGSVILAFMAAVGHVLVLIYFLLTAYAKQKDIFISFKNFTINLKRSKPAKWIIKVLAYLISFYWLWDFIEVTKIKFFGTLLAFTIVAILVTWTYAVWITNLTQRNPLSGSTNA